MKQNIMHTEFGRKRFPFSDLYCIKKVCVQRLLCGYCEVRLKETHSLNTPVRNNHGKCERKKKKSYYGRLLFHDSMFVQAELMK